MAYELKSVCPTCGATGKHEGLGRDGSPRVLAPYATPLSLDPVIVDRRERARAISAANAARLA